MSPKRQLEEYLGAALAKRGWFLERIENIHRVFARRDVFTPYFWPNVAARSSGLYSFSGYVGVFDREFESIWRRSHPEERPCFPLLMHSANFAELCVDDVESPAFEEGADSFALALHTFLSKGPCKRADMRIAFENGELFGMDIKNFGMVLDTPSAMVTSAKFEEFRAFLSKPH
jgi:hypothetical protein